MSLKDQIDPQKLPEHIAIIMDGNGRWAKRNGKKRIFGHRKGVESVRVITEACAEIGIKYLTLYAFSTENWARPKLEVLGLMNLLVNTIRKETKTLNKNNIRLSAIGDLKTLPGDCYDNLQESMRITEKNDRMDLILALSYSSRNELVRAMKKMATDVTTDKLSVNDISDDTISNYLDTSHIPDPELLIRTSGETRISNYLLWQIAYTELYFTETLWPDFDEDALYTAILDFQNRERRFGKTSEQIIS